MKIHNSIILEMQKPPVSYASSSQNAQVNGSWHNSDMAQQYMTAQRLQETIKAMPTKKVSSCETARTVCYKTAIGLGVLTFPAIVCAFFVKNGWTIPAGCAVSSLLLFCLAGKRTEEIKTMSRDLEEANNQTQGQIV